MFPSWPSYSKNEAKIVSNIILSNKGEAAVIIGYILNGILLKDLIDMDLLAKINRV